MPDPEARTTAGGEEEAAATLTSVMPRWLVVPLAVVAFLLACGVLLLLVLSPGHLVALERPLGRGILCLALATYTSVFLFAIYPFRLRHEYSVQGVTVRLVGPSALLVFLFVLLVETLPSGSYAELFVPRDEDGRRREIGFQQLGIESREPADAECRLVPTQTEYPADLHGVYVRFPAGVTTVTADIALPPSSEKVELVFERGAGSFLLP